MKPYLFFPLVKQKIPGNADNLKWIMQWCIHCLVGNGLVQGAVAMLYAAGFGFVYRSSRVFHIAMDAQFVFFFFGFGAFASVGVLVRFGKWFKAVIGCCCSPAATSDSRQFLNVEWLSKNSFE